jgi:hypothetical protein
MKKELQILRLEPDGFVLTKGNTKTLLEVTARGEMVSTIHFFFVLQRPLASNSSYQTIDVFQNYTNK